MMKWHTMKWVLTAALAFAFAVPAVAQAGLAPWHPGIFANTPKLPAPEPAPDPEPEPDPEPPIIGLMPVVGPDGIEFWVTYDEWSDCSNGCGC